MRREDKGSKGEMTARKCSKKRRVRERRRRGEGGEVKEEFLLKNCLEIVIGKGMIKMEMAR